MSKRAFVVPALALAAAGLAGCGSSSKATGIVLVPAQGATAAPVATTPKPAPAISNKPTVTVPSGYRVEEFGRRLDAAIRRAGYAPLRLDLAQDLGFAATAVPLGVSLTRRGDA